MQNQRVLVLDFGGQYNQLIARRVRECNVYCEVKPHSMTIDEIKAYDPIGIIFTGGPQSVYAAGSPQVDAKIFELGIPVLGICYGCQLMAHYLGGEVTAAQSDTAREYGKTPTFFDTDCRLFKGLPEESVTWMSHGDYMAKVPESFRLVAHSAACPTVGICDEARGFYGVQFHPEVNHTEYGQKMLHNFLYEVCGAKGDWTMGDYMRASIESIRTKVGDGKVLLALSGGVDSAVAAALLYRAVGEQLTCIFVDHGLLRKNEKEEVCSVFGPGNANGFDINFICVDARDRYFSKLKGVTEPERKRKIIGEEFIGDDSVAMVLGDNIFFGHGLNKRLKAAVENAETGKGATVFGYYVDDPERFGIVEFDSEGKAISIEEKPEKPKSNYCVTGLYFYDNRVVEYAKNLKPSARGELEITDLNRIYLENGELDVTLLGQGFTWLDTGTHESLVEATNFVKTIETHQHRKIACLEEIAYTNGWISKEEVMAAYEIYKKNQYGQYLKDVIDGKYIDKLPGHADK